MAAVRKHARVAAAQPGFLTLKSENVGSKIGRRKRVNKNKKKNWNKHSDIQDVEEFLDDVRLQERATGGLIANKPDAGLFFVDTGNKVADATPEPTKKLCKRSKPLRIDLILQPDSQIPAPKDILAYQHPNAKKERRRAQKAEKLAAKGILTRHEKLRQMNKAATHTQTKERPVANNNPTRSFFDLWSAEEPETADPFYLEQTKRKLVMRPERLKRKPSILPSVEVIGPGGSYNPDFLSHQMLLHEAHEVEVKKLKAEEKLGRQLAVDREHIATEESILKEQLEGLIDEDEEEIKDEIENPAADVAVGPAAQREKKTEKQRRREKEERKKELQKKAEQKVIDSRQQLFQLRSVGVELKKREQRTKMRQIKRREKQEAEKINPRRLGRQQFQAPDLDVQLSDELAGSLRTLKPEGSVLKDRFKSLQKRNLIEPRERAKFKRKYRLKYAEKRAFKDIK